MGKASKWIRNFLVGKKEEKDKKKESSFSAENLATPTSILAAATAKERRRWSFGRSASADTAGLKSSRSFDAVATSQLVTKALLLEYHENARAVPVAITQQEVTKTILVAKLAPGPVENAAATKIQAIFRSYLARRALFALRGLVKLQALVRGHLVRKRTNATLRCMHALIAIQVRARVQRVQMAEEESQLQPPRRATQLRELVLDNHHPKPYCETRDVIISETRADLERRSCHIDHLHHPQIKRMEQPRISISKKRENQLQICATPPPSALADMSSSRTHKYTPQFEDYASTPSQRSSQARAPFAVPLPEYPWMPNYMANTESSRAKVRSQSEPKQRPKSSTKKRSTSSEKVDMTEVDIIRTSSSQARPHAQKNQYPWLIKLYRSTKRAIKYSECDSISPTTTSTSNDCKSLIAYEPPLNIY